MKNNTIKKAIINELYELCSNNLDIEFENIYLTKNNKLYIEINDILYEISIKEIESESDL